MTNLEKYKKYGEFTLSSGEETGYYYDLKEGMGTQEGLIEIAQPIIEQLEAMDKLPDVLIGLEYGGVPLVICISLALDIPYAVFRKDRKEWGTMKVIEGYQGKGRAVIIDDVETTGNSLDKAEGYLTVCGYDVVGRMTVIKRER